MLYHDGYNISRWQSFHLHYNFLFEIGSHSVAYVEDTFRLGAALLLHLPSSGVTDKKYYLPCLTSTVILQDHYICCVVHCWPLPNETRNWHVWLTKLYHICFPIFLAPHWRTTEMEPLCSLSVCSAPVTILGTECNCRMSEWMIQEDMSKWVLWPHCGETVEEGMPQVTDDRESFLTVVHRYPTSTHVLNVG